MDSVVPSRSCTPCEKIPPPELPPPSPEPLPTTAKFAFGGFAGFLASLGSAPLEILKAPLQLIQDGQGKSVIEVLKDSLSNEDVSAIYKRMPARLLANSLYSTVRLGVYTHLFDTITGEEKESPGVTLEALAGGAAGASGTVASAPFHHCIARLEQNELLPPEQQRTFKNFSQTFRKIAREEGIWSLWRGSGIAVNQAMLVNAVELASYSEGKRVLRGSGAFDEDIRLHFSSSLLSGLASAGIALPIDTVKTRWESMVAKEARPEYLSRMDALHRVVTTESIASLWRGYFPYYLRVGPHVTLTFIILEQMNSSYFDWAGVQGKSSL